MKPTTINIGIKKLHPLARIPKQMTELAAGYDLYSCNSEDITLKPGKVKMVPTGLSISLPRGFEAQIRPRSGLASKNGIGVLNSPGTIDADYRGEIMVILFNFGEQEFTIYSGMRIAQMIIARHEFVEFDLVEELPETARGEKGFGHTKTD
jgi:dUTP pyrophosphatase